MEILIFLVVVGLVLLVLFLRVDTTDKPDDNSFLKAVRLGEAGSVRAFLDKGTSPNEAYDDRTTALHIAVDEGHADVVKLLVSRGANVNAKRLDGTTPLHYAARGIDESSRRCKGWVRDLTDWSMEDSDALAGENAALIEPLLQARADISAKDSCDMIPLHYAAITNNLEGAKQLIAAGSELEAEAEESSPLILAVEMEFLEMIELLVKSGAKVNASVEGWTPLMEAISVDAPEAARLLLRLGADKTLKDRDGCDALAIAEGFGSTEIAALLRGEPLALHHK